MSIKIRPIKCPNCGSEKHDQLNEKLYRCKNCGTEYFLDDDDIIVHVKHDFNYDGFTQPKREPKNSFSNTKRNFVVIGIVFLFLYGAMFLWDGNNKGKNRLFSSDLFSNDSISVVDQYNIIIPMMHKGRVCFFYITERNIDYKIDDDKTLADGYYYGFVDAQTGKVLADKLLISDDESKRVDMTSINELKIWHLYQADKWLCLIPKQFIYEINPQTLTMNNISKTIFANKEAMSSGISSVNFIFRINDGHANSLEGGEGFEVSNNLAENYYYFPATDHLYTEEAYKYAQKLPASGLKGELRKDVMYELESKNSSGSSNQKGQNIINRVQYTHYLGNPQYLNDSRNGKYDFVYSDMRVVDNQPITDWFTGFDAELIYQDSKYLCIEYKANISKNAPTILQLRNTNGGILWTRSLDCPIKIGGVLRDNQKIWFRATREHTDRYDDEYIMSLTLKGGNIKYEYKFATSHNVRKQ